MKGYYMSDEDYNPQNKLKMLLDQYITAATDLAESVKKDILKGGKISKNTNVALNKFIITANEIDFLKYDLTASKMKLN